MNNKIRKTIQTLHDQLGDIRESLETIKDDEQIKYDNLPDSFRDGDMGENIQTAIDYLNEVIGSIEEAEAGLEEI